MTPKFAIFYSDGSVVEGGGEEDELVEVTLRVSRDWLQAPTDGVQAVIMEDAYVGRTVQRRMDYYYQIDGGHPHSADNIHPFLKEHLRGLVKMGVFISPEKYEELWDVIKAYEGIQPLKPRRPRPDE